MPTLHLTSYNPETDASVQTPLPLTQAGDVCRLHLHRLTGADGIHLLFEEREGDETTLHRFELTAELDIDVELEVRWTTDGLELFSPGRKVLYLPPDPECGPESESGSGKWKGGAVRPFKPNTDSGRLDLALVIDGSTRHWDDEGDLVSLVGLKKHWSRQVEELLSLVAALSADQDQVRVAVLAYGDQAPPRAGSDDLIPKYNLWPATPGQRQLELQHGADALKETLSGVPPTTGGDFVDALADALNACADLTWSPGARKLVIVVGDSPGYSVSRPAPWGADACVREYDVETEAARLQDLGVEVVTIYHSPPRDSGLYDDANSMPCCLLEYAAEQFRRLASWENYFCKSRHYSPENLARQIRSQTRPVARASSWGVLVSVD